MLWVTSVVTCSLAYPNLSSTLLLSVLKYVPSLKCGRNLFILRPVYMYRSMYIYIFIYCYVNY
jgi:hypothetical protein